MTKLYNKILLAILLFVACIQLSTLRGSILEDCIPSTSKLSTSRGLAPKDVLDYVVPGLNVSCLRHAIVDEKTNNQLLRLDEQAVRSSCYSSLVVEGVYCDELVCLCVYVSVREQFSGPRVQTSPAGCWNASGKFYFYYTH